MKIKLNQSKIANVLSKNTKMKNLISKQVHKLVQEYVDNSKDQMVSEYENHPVTKEIKNGPDAINISNTLGGQGNLFSYIGFEEGSNPTDIVKDMLETSVQVPNRPEISVNGKNIKINFPVSGPTLNEIESITPMPFEGGRSWTTGIEKGISGFSYYIFKKFIKNSRSSTGIQSESEVRSGSFKPSPYLSGILKKFYSKVNSKFNI
jgi:hypothetical protein